jgi:hypothetical protein
VTYLAGQPKLTRQRLRELFNYRFILQQIVLNPPTYPNFLRFLRLLKIPLLDTEMTFSVTRDRGMFEWAGDGLGALFCQIGNLCVECNLEWPVLRLASILVSTA